MSHSDLWQITSGELADRYIAYLYQQRERVKERALLATWICNLSGMRSSPLKLEDLIGYEDPDTGRVFSSKWDYHDHSREKALKNRGE